jgi:hypothetical protein
MKTPFPLALGSALCLLLTSCVVTSENPLSSPHTAHADQQFVGDWFGKKDLNTFRFTLTKAPWMHVEIIPAKAGEKTDSYDFFPTVIGNNTFLNVVLIGKDDQGHPTKAYVFVRYSISGNRVLQMWRMSQDAAAAAVRAGKLTGIVDQDKNPMMVGQPPHPEVDVTLHDTGSKIVKFIQNSGVDELFSDTMEPLYRVMPTGK